MPPLWPGQDITAVVDCRATAVFPAVVREMRPWIDELRARANGEAAPLRCYADARFDENVARRYAGAQLDEKAVL
eukprot:1569468-Lingulodinium_polyedra.AAC.1